MFIKSSNSKNTSEILRSPSSFELHKHESWKDYQRSHPDTVSSLWQQPGNLVSTAKIHQVGYLVDWRFRVINQINGLISLRCVGCRAVHFGTTRFFFSLLYPHFPYK